MSYPDPTRLDGLALANPCARCQAKPGAWCVSTHHGYAYQLHKVRTAPIAAAFDAGVIAGTRAARRRATVRRAA